MAFQLGAFQCNAFQTPLLDKRPSGGYGQAWVTFPRKDGKREKLAITIKDDDEILVAIRAFVDEVLSR